MEIETKLKPMELEECPVKTTVDVVGGKWKPLILYWLNAGPQRFSELRRHIPDATQKMLTQQLRELERDGVVRRRVFAEVPPKVEYSFTKHGQSLKPLLKLMCNWGNRHRRRRGVVKAEPRTD